MRPGGPYKDRSRYRCYRTPETQNHPRSGMGLGPKFSDLLIKNVIKRFTAGFEGLRILLKDDICVYVLKKEVLKRVLLPRWTLGSEIKS